MDILTCRHCGKPIGVYEPIIVEADGDLRETSRVVEPDLCSAQGEHYHRACHAARLGDEGVE